MTLIEIKKQITEVKGDLLEMQKIASFVETEMFESHINNEGESEPPFLMRGELMSESFPDKNKELQLLWDNVKKNIPAGLSVDGNLIRHLSFNEAHDWFDIANNDIPREIKKLNDYEVQLGLIEYLENLHPEVNRISNIVLNGDIDAALKTVFASLDSKIRLAVKAKPSESTVSLIGKAFNDGTLVTPDPANKFAAANFLQGVVGYYRNNILHNDLPANRESVVASLSLFGIAHESFRLLDLCTKHHK
jgi:hypothetical protein